MVLAGISLASMRMTPWAAWGAGSVVVCLTANWFGDSLDGTVARVRSQQRPRYGYYVDHVIDLAGAVAVLIGMGASGLMEPAIALALLASFLLVSAEAYLATHTVGVFRLSFGGVGPTELRLLLAAGGFYVAAHPWVDVAGWNVRLLDVGGLIAIAGLIVAFIASAITNTRALYLAEPLP